MNRIITIGREFGSGGRELGRRLAEKFHIAYYDQEIITKLAQRMDLSEEYLRQVTERRPIIPFPINVGRSFYLAPNPIFEQSISAYAEQHKLLRELFCVFSSTQIKPARSSGAWSASRRRKI